MNQEIEYIKGYGFLSFAKNIGKSLSNKYGQKLLDSAKKSTADAIKTASKRAMQKTAEATGDLIGNKIADKITSVSKKSNNNNNERYIHTCKGNYNNYWKCRRRTKNNNNNNNSNNNNNKNEDVEITAHKKRYISPEERQQIINELRLVPKNY